MTDAISYKPEVFAHGEWAGNALRFATEEEAERYVADLFRRWTAVDRTRVVESTDPVTCAIIDGVLTHLADRAPPATGPAA